MGQRKAVSLINPQSTQPISCVNCQAVTTSDGQTVWVCERCGTENAPTVPDSADAQAVITEAVAAVSVPPVADMTSAANQVPDLTAGNSAMNYVSPAPVVPVVPAAPVPPMAPVAPAAPVKPI